MKLPKAVTRHLPQCPQAIIFIVAFTVRVILLSRIPYIDLLYGHLTSEGLKSGEEGINVAVNLFLTGRFADPFCIPTGATAHLPPAFPAVTAIVFHIFGVGLTAAVARNIINIAGYSILFATLPAAATALNMTRSAGILAGLAAAVYPIFRSAEVFRGRDEWLAALLLLWLTVFVLHLSRERTLHLRSAVIYGAGWGTLMYVQPSTVTIFPIHLIALLVAHRSKPLLLRVKYAAVAVFLMAAVIIPWTIRNRLAMGGWLFMRDNLGLELYISNADFARASQQENQAIWWYCSVHPICSVVQAKEVRQLGELDFNRRALHAASVWIISNKKSFLKLTLERVFYFWADSPVRPTTFLVRAVLSFTGFVGLALMLRDRLLFQVALLGAIVLIYPLPYYVIQYSIRYAAVISFALLLPAAFALNRLGAALFVSRRI